MKKYQIRTRTKKLLADTITPVSIYLRIRDIYPNSLLLESSDYHGNENSYSFICVKSIASFEIDDGVATETYPDGNIVITPLSAPPVFRSRFSGFLNSFEQADGNDEVPVNGLFGYTSYDAVQYFEKLKFSCQSG